jgi:hypothetical protein
VFPNGNTRCHTAPVTGDVSVATPGAVGTALRKCSERQP